MSTKFSHKTLALIVGPVLAGIVMLLLEQANRSSGECWTAAVTTLCAVWWCLEPIPLPATALIPLAIFPVVGVLNHQQVATAYGNRLILLMLGGFIMSTAMEKSGAHQRLALGVVRLVGNCSSKNLVLGFIMISALLSMWISNAPTTIMLISVATCLLEQCSDRRLAAPLLLGIAYGASIGGIGTPIGTPPNLIFIAQYERMTGDEVSFLDWMRLGLPMVFLMIPLIWLWLTRDLQGHSKLKLPKLGAWRSPEKRVLTVFGITALAWITRTEPFGGWSGWFGIPGVDDGTVALLMVVLLFILPDGEGGKLLDWENAKRLPWDVLILLSGGLTLAKAFQKSGLSEWLGHSLSGLSTLPTLLMIAGICLAVTFLTEITSNTAVTTLLMPILGTAALGAHLNPVLLMFPAAISASFAFMLPVATVPNAIVYSTGEFSVKQMMSEGFILNLLGALACTLLCYWLLVVNGSNIF